MTSVSLKELRELAKKMRESSVTQKEVATALGCSERFVQMVFKGERTSIKVIVKAKELLAMKSTEEFQKAVKKHFSIMKTL